MVPDLYIRYLLTCLIIIIIIIVNVFFIQINSYSVSNKVKNGQKCIQKTQNANMQLKGLNEEIDFTLYFLFILIFSVFDVYGFFRANVLVCDFGEVYLPPVIQSGHT